MPVYLIIEVEVTDPDTYAQYVEKVPAIVKKFGGRYMARGGEVTPLAGDWQPERVILLEFPSAERLRNWLASPEYAPLAALRGKSAKARAVVVEGCPPDDVKLSSTQGKARSGFLTLNLAPTDDSSKRCPSLQTDRLVLRPFELSDADDVRRLAGERVIADTTLNIPHPYEDGMAEEWIATHQPGFEAGTSANFAVVLRAEDALIGAIGLRIGPEIEKAVLGYWIATARWNNGYCTEAARAMLRFGFETLYLNRIHASHLTRNPASGKVMQKIGMMHEGRGREHVKKWGIFEDVEFYGILKNEWKE